MRSLDEPLGAAAHCRHRQRRIDEVKLRGLAQRVGGPQVNAPGGLILDDHEPPQRVQVLLDGFDASVGSSAPPVSRASVATEASVADVSPDASEQPPDLDRIAAVSA